MTELLIVSIKKLLIPVLVILAIWLFLAWQSGMFLKKSTAIDGHQRTASSFSQKKKFIRIGEHNVAYAEMGQGEPLLLLHGCPFSAAEWQYVMPILAQHYRVIAPDWLGLGDTEVTMQDDYRLPQDLKLLTGLMDALGLAQADFIAHDHGGAVAQLMMAQHPQRIKRLVLTNVEAYDQWPSKPEIKYLKAIVNPLSSPFVYAALKFEAVQREVFSIAVHDPNTLTSEILAEWTSAHNASPARWQRLRRFFNWQLDPEHNRVTLTAVPAMREYTKPVLLLWGQQDTNFGVGLAERLQKDIPGAVDIRYLENSAHMPMVEQPQEYADAALEFLRGAATRLHVTPEQPDSNDLEKVIYAK